MDTPIALFLEGENALAQIEHIREQTKVGVFRGGSCGCLLPDNTYIGDIYKDLARYLGYQRPIYNRIYLDAGIANELIWERNLSQLDTKGVYFKSEEEIPVTYNFDGYTATGRPDLVIGEYSLKGEFVPRYGVELKAKNTLKESAKVLIGNKIDPVHLCQAGFYAKVLNIPYYLVYSSGVSGELGYFEKRDFGVNTVSPGKIEHTITWIDDTLYVNDEKTVITFTGILDYWRVIGEMAKTQQLVQLRHCSKDAFGNSMPYDLNLYLDFPLAVNINQTYQQWVEDVQRYIKVPSNINLSYSKNKYVVAETSFGRVGNIIYLDTVRKDAYINLTDARMALFKEII